MSDIETERTFEFIVREHLWPHVAPLLRRLRTAHRSGGGFSRMRRKSDRVRLTLTGPSAIVDITAATTAGIIKTLDGQRDRTDFSDVRRAMASGDSDSALEVMQRRVRELYP